MLAFYACDGRPAHHAKRHVEWPGVPRHGETVTTHLQPEDDDEYPVESVSWDSEGGCVVFLGRIQANDELRAAAKANDAESVLAFWKHHLERVGWDVTGHPWPAE